MVKNTLVLLNKFATKLPLDTYKAVLMTVFFLPKPCKSSAQTQKLKEFFWNPFFLQNFPLDPLTAVLASWQTNHKNSTNVRKIFAHSPKKKKLIKNLLNVSLRKYHVDTRDSDWTTHLEVVFTKDPNFLLVEVHEYEAQIPIRSYC